MSKAVKSVAAIALPIALSLAAPGIGTALGSTLASSTLAGIGGAVGGGIGGAIKGGGVGGILKGAAIGGVGGYLSGGGASDLFGGTAIGDALGLADPAVAAGTGAVGPIASTASAGMSAGDQAFLNNVAGAANAPIGAAVAGGGARTIGLGTVGNVLTGANALATLNSADAAKDAAKIQAGAVDKAVQTQAPYNQLGTDAAAQIAQIQKDPGAYVQNNPFYKSLADDAQQRLLANQAAKGKVGSGGTADALQTSLLNLGNGLVQQQVGTLQNQVNTGQNSANAVSGLQTDRGAVQAAGVVGASNALQTGYQNQISTLLALQNLGRTPSYSPTQQLRA